MAKNKELENEEQYRLLQDQEEGESKESLREIGASAPKRGLEVPLVFSRGVSATKTNIAIVLFLVSAACNIFLIILLIIPHFYPTIQAQSEVQLGPSSISPYGWSPIFRQAYPRGIVYADIT